MTYLFFISDVVSLFVLRRTYILNIEMIKTKRVGWGVVMVVVCVCDKVSYEVNLLHGLLSSVYKVSLLKTKKVSPASKREIMASQLLGLSFIVCENCHLYFLYIFRHWYFYLLT